MIQVAMKGYAYDYNGIDILHAWCDYRYKVDGNRSRVQ